MKKLVKFLLAILPLYVFGQCPPTACPTGNCFCISTTTTTDSVGTLYDDGGPGNEYTADLATVNHAFAIESAGEPIFLQFTQFSLETSLTGRACGEFDYVEVLDGGVSLGRWCGNEKPPGNLVCNSGVAIVRMYSDESGVADGFEMNWYFGQFPDTAEYCRVGPDTCGALFNDGMNVTFQEVSITQVGMDTDDGRKDSNTGCDSYGDYTNFEFPLSFGGQYLLYLTSSNNNLLATARAWVDWNKNKVFDADEAVQLPRDGTSGTNYFGTVVPPATALDGRYRLRVMLGGNVPPEPCDKEFEAEDYTIVLGTPPPNCAENVSPANMTTGLCQKDISFTWDSASVGTQTTGYKFFLGTDNSPTNIYDGIDLGDVENFDLPDTVTLAANTAYYWRVIAYNETGDAESCEVYQFTTSANGDPVPSIDFEGAATFANLSCDGATSNLLVSQGTSGTAPFTYNWSGDDLSPLTTNNDLASFNSTSVGSTFLYFVEVTDANGCTGLDSVSIEVVANADAGNLTGNLVVCEGEVVKLSSDAAGSDSYQWQANFGSGFSDISGSTTKNYTENNPVDAAEYRLIADNANGCADTSSAIQITVNPTPSAPLVTSSTGVFDFCDGESITLSSDQSAGNNWSTGETTQDIVVDNSGVVTLTYTDNNGCESAETSLTITEFSLPAKPVINEADNNGEANLCVGSEITLSIGNTSNDIAWNGDAAINTQSIQVNASGTFFVEVSDANGCVNRSDDVDVVERALPDAPTISSADDAVGYCSGASLELTAASAESNLYWNNDMSITGSTFTASAAGDYFVTAVNAFGCENTSSLFNVVEFALPTKPVISGGDNGDDAAFCAGDSLRLSTSSTDALYWNEDPSGVTGNELYASTPGDYVVTAVSAEGCEQQSDVYTVTENPLPQKPVITQSGNTLICSGNFTLIQWFDAEEGDPIQGADQDEFIPSQDGTYEVEVTDENTGCINRSDAFQFTSVGIAEFGKGGSVKVYPNPVLRGKSIVVEADFTIASTVLYNAVGAEVARAKGAELSSRDLAPGVYHITYQKEGDATVYSAGRVVIQ